VTTRVAPATPEEYIASLKEPRRSEVEQVDRLIRETLPDLEHHICSGMIGYGSYRYRYASGREGVTFRIGLASQKAHLSVYCNAADEHGYVAERYRDRLPSASIGRSCVRFKAVSDLDEGAFCDLLREAAEKPFGI
jgi:hypothetical protein